METQTLEQSHKPFVPWNRGKVTGPKPPLKPREVWAIPREASDLKSSA